MATIGTLQRRLAASRVSYANIHSDAAHLRVENASLQQNVATWRANTAGTVRALTSTIDELRTKNHGLEERIEAFKSRNCEFKTRCQVLDKQVEALREKMRKMVGRNADLVGCAMEMMEVGQRWTEGEGKVDEDLSNTDAEERMEGGSGENVGEEQPLMNQLPYELETARDAGASWGSETCGSLGGSTVVGSDVGHDDDGDEDADDESVVDSDPDDDADDENKEWVEVEVEAAGTLDFVEMDFVDMEAETEAEEWV
jgi:FtsZ-binding cell division protein ZapB